MSLPTDQAARDRIVTSLDETLVVEAGAGTGKTRALVARIVRLVLVGEVPLREIAAITFTEAAAAELRDRIRASLERVQQTGMIPAAGESEETLDLLSGANLADAFQSLDDATITTLHGFAQRILAEHPLEAGLPPRFVVRDEVQSSVDFEDRWSSTLDHLLEDPVLEPVTVRGLTVGLTLSRLRDIARAFHNQWHRTRDWLASLPPPAPVRFPDVDLKSVLVEIESLVAMADLNRTPDPLLDRLAEFADFAEALATATDDDERLSLLMAPPNCSVGRTGRAPNWQPGAATRVREQVAGVAAVIATVLDAQRVVVLDSLARRVGEAIVAAAGDRRTRGELDFHDLLVLARDLVRDDPAVRAILHARYRRILIDEFQDTDPLQIEIATLLAAADSTTAADQPWYETAVEPGRLFVVGDPKQSIYRFRSADVALYARVLAVHGDHRVLLSDNFRSTPDVLRYVNTVLPSLFAEGALGAQVPYEALVATRPTTDNPRVKTIGGESSERIDAIREREASDVAAVIRTAVTDGWPVQHRQLGGRRVEARARYADVAILLPTRTALRQIEDALDDAGIAYRVESKSLVYSTAEVRELLAVLASIDDPTDEVALVAALRTPAFACGDDDLLAFHQAGGRWDYRFPRATLPERHPVMRALTTLATYHEQRRWLTVSELVDRVLRDRKFLELALAARRPRDRWRRYRFLADQARAFCSGGGRDLRTFLAWAERQADERASVNEVVAPETDDDAVRILTVHGAKGLEFPIVVLAGLNAGARTDTPPVIWTDIGCSIGTGDLTTPGYEAALDYERAMGAAERVRLLYVAATRAEDHLVVSLHHGRKSDAASLAAAGDRAGLALDWRPEPPMVTGPTSPLTAEDSPTGDADAGARVLAERTAWAARRAQRLAALRRTRVVAATAVAALAAGARPEPAAPNDVSDHDVGSAELEDDSGWVEAPDPPRRRGRAGTARGRAVHAVLQTVDLVTGAGLEEAARAQAEAEGIADLRTDVVRLARAALDSAVVRAAVGAPRRWRELALATPVEGMVLEGFIDLLYETDAGLVLVDYKTDHLSGDPEEESAAIAHYELQLAAYAAALEAILGRPVARAVLLFVGSGSAREVNVSDLAGAVAHVRTVLSAESNRLDQLLATATTSG